MNLNDIWSAKSKLAEARAATASFRAGNKKRANLNAMSDEERRAYDKEQQEKQRKRDDARLERERSKKQDEMEEGYSMADVQRDAQANARKTIDAATAPKEKTPFMAQVGKKIIGGVAGAVTGGVKGAYKGFTGQNEGEMAEEAAPFGMNYAEQLAQQVFDHDSSLNNEDDILNLGYKIAKSELGSRAQGIFRSEDFPGDFVSAYGYLKKQGVEEGSEQYHGRGKDAYQRDYDSSVSGFERPRDHRGLGQELAHERNNIQVSINGKPWRVFPGRGTADSREEWSHLQSMKDWAAKKSASTGKKWSVSLTGSSPTMEEAVAEGTGLSAELLANYKKSAGISARDLDKAGKYDKANKRFHGIVQATKKEFDNDAKKHNKQEDVSSIPQNDTTSPIHEDIESRLNQMKRAGYDL